MDLTVKTGVLAIALSLSFVCGSVKAADTPAVHEKVVFQVSDNDPKKWNLALNNARNVQDSFGADKVDVEIVTYGPGVDMLKFDSIVGNRVNEAENAGVRIVACQNTMKSMHLTRNDMLSSIGYVPGGVVELIKKQREGWAYIRP